MNFKCNNLNNIYEKISTTIIKKISQNEDI